MTEFLPNFSRVLVITVFDDDRTRLGFLIDVGKGLVQPLSLLFIKCGVCHDMIWIDEMVEALRFKCDLGSFLVAQPGGFILEFLVVSTRDLVVLGPLFELLVSDRLG